MSTWQPTTRTPVGSKLFVRPNRAVAQSDAESEVDDVVAEESDCSSPSPSSDEST